MLSLSLKRYYEPLRLPIQPGMISLPYTCLFMTDVNTIPDLQHWVNYLPLHAIPATPVDSTIASVLFIVDVSLPHTSTRSTSTYFRLTRLHPGSLSLQPATLPLRNLQHFVTKMLLLRTNMVYGQFHVRDLNPLDN